MGKVPDRGCSLTPAGGWMHTTREGERDTVLKVWCRGGKRMGCRDTMELHFEAIESGAG